jgi:hypothetical protein
MHSLNRKAAVIGIFVLAIALVAPLLTRADESNTATSFTIDRPFEVPGMVLQPNTPYVIALIDSPGARNIVQIYNEDQSKMLTTFMAVSSDRPEPEDRPVFTFIKTEPEFPLPIKKWFYPGHQHSLEFVYPKQQAMKIAGYAGESILSANTTNLNDLNMIQVETINAGNPQYQMVQNTAGQRTENEPNQAEEQQDKPSEHSNTTETDQELPATDGELSLVALIGLLCIGAGLAMKVLSTRS